MLPIIAGEMGKENPRITFADREHTPFDQVQKKLDQLHDLKQSISKDLSVIGDHVELVVNFREPINLVPLSDFHLASIYTDRQKVEEILGKLKEENTYGYITGDFIEGAHRGITEHIGSVELDFRQQVWVAKEMIRPFVETGKILCLVGTFFGHEEWGSSLLGYDMVQEMAHGFKQPDGTPLKVVHNGGRLIVHLADGSTYTQLLYHDAGGGGSDEVNPLGSQRERLREYISHSGSINGAGAGHRHHRAGVSKEISFDPVTNKERSHILYATGTPKGTDPENPDTFLTRQAKGPSRPPGVQLILSPLGRKNGNGEYAWVSYGYQKGEILYDAARLWNVAEQTGMTKGLVEEIVHHTRKTKAEFDRPNSRTKAKEKRFDTPFFTKFNWKIENSHKLPILVYTLANARYGSTSFETRDREKLLEVLSHASRNPFEYVLVMRHFIDSGVAKEFDRRDTLDHMIADLKEISDQGCLLGIMMSSSLVDARWKKDALGDRIEVDDEKPDRHGDYDTHWETERDPGFRPGDVLYQRLNKVPLFLNQSIMHLKYGSALYEFLLLDHLSHSGSEFDPFRGLVQARRKSYLASDIVTGGHMPNAGFMTTPDANYIAPGWFSDYDSRGKANQRRAPLGGQGVVLFPDRKLVVPTSSFLESTDTHTALMLLTGLDKATREKILKKSR